MIFTHKIQGLRQYSHYTDDSLQGGGACMIQIFKGNFWSYYARSPRVKMESKIFENTHGQFLI